MAGIIPATKLEVADIEIGAVELKDGTSDIRATVSTSGSANLLNVGIINSDGNQISQTYPLPVEITSSPETADIIWDGTNEAIVVVQNIVPTTTVTATHLDTRHLNTTDDAVNVGTVTTLPSITGTVTANAGTNLNTSALATASKQDTLLTELQLKADLTETQPVSISSLPLPSGASTEATLSDLNNSTYLLRRIVKLLESNAVVDSLNRQKVTVEGATITSGTVTTVGTVTTATVSNTAALGSVDGRFLFIDTARNAYANGIRNNLNWS